MSALPPGDPRHPHYNPDPHAHPGLHAIALVEGSKGALALLAASGLELLGPVQYLRAEGGRAATATYKGYMAELENVRDALRAWTLTQGEEAIGRPFEVYKNGIDQAFTANGQYDVYWMIK